MKVELQCGDTITIPEGCKATIRDGSVAFEKDQEFKDGDVLTLLHNNKAVFIFREDEVKQKNNENDYYVGYTASYCIDVPTKGSPFFYGHKKDVRLATEEEKQFLFNKMKERGLRWNAEEKRVEKMRWRAKKGDSYYFTESIDAGVLSNHEADDKIDYILWRSYNYFRTEEQAREAAKRVKEALRKYHEEIGE